MGATRSTSEKPTRYPEPRRLFVTTVLAVFAGEAAVMVLLRYLPPLQPAAEALLDALLLTGLVVPLLYLSLCAPMRRHIAERAKVEEELREAKTGLEARVAKRTAELDSTVDSLRREVEVRRRTEEDLRKTNVFIRSIVQSAPFLIVIYAVDTLRCSFANARLEDLLGYVPEEAAFEGQGFFRKILGPEDYAAFVRWNETLAQRGSVSQETRGLVLRDSKAEPKSCAVSVSVLSSTEDGAPKDALFVAMECRSESNRESPGGSWTGGRATD
jgi:PAS domain-containing protein